MISIRRTLSLLFSLIAASCITSISCAQDTISIEFDGKKVLPETFSLNGFDAINGTPATEIASFTISEITGPDLIVSLNALGDSINLRSHGLADGVGEFDNTGEGFTLSFNRDVELISFDWGAFGDDDEGTLIFSSGMDSILVAESDSSWSNARTDVQSLGIALSESDSVTLEYSSGSFVLQGLTLKTQSVVPEPSFYACTAGSISLLITLMIRRRKRIRLYYKD